MRRSVQTVPDRADNRQRLCRRRRRRSNIPTVRCASSSASPPAAGPTSSRAQSARSSAPISGRISLSRTVSAPTAPSPPRRSPMRRRTATRCSIPAPAISTTPYIYKKAAFDVLRDFAPIATAASSTATCWWSIRRRRCKTVPEFIAYAKANRVLYGSPGVGNLLHSPPSCSTSRPGIKMEHVPYRGASEVLTALLQGSIQVMFLSPTTALALVEEGKLRAIGFTGTQAVSGAAGRAAGQRVGAELPAVEHLGHLLRAGEDAAGDRRQAQRRDPARLDGAGGRQCGAAKAGYVPDGRTAGADGGILPQGSRGGRRGGEGRRNPAELNHQSRNRCKPCLMQISAASPSTTKSSASSGPSMALSPGGRNPYQQHHADRRAAWRRRAIACCCTTGAIAARPTSSFDPAASRNTRSGPTISTRCCKQFDMAPAIIGGSSSGARLALTFALRLSAVGAGADAVARHRRRLRGQAARRALLRPVRPPGGRGRHGGGLRRGAFRRADPQAAVQPRAADGDRSEGVHRDHAGLARAVRGGRRAAADRHHRGRPALDQGADLHHPGQRSHPRQRDRRGAPRG